MLRPAYATITEAARRLTPRRATLTIAGLMPDKHRPTAEDRLTVIRRALTGLAGEKAIEDVAVDLAPLHPEHDTFPAEVLLELAADALEISGANRHDPVQYDFVTINARIVPRTARPTLGDRSPPRRHGGLGHRLDRNHHIVAEAVPL